MIIFRPKSLLVSVGSSISFFLAEAVVKFVCLCMFLCVLIVVVFVFLFRVLLLVGVLLLGLVVKTSSMKDETQPTKEEQ